MLCLLSERRKPSLKKLNNLLKQLRKNRRQKLPPSLKKSQKLKPTSTSKKKSRKSSMESLLKFHSHSHPLLKLKRRKKLPMMLQSKRRNLRERNDTETIPTSVAEVDAEADEVEQT